MADAVTVHCPACETAFPVDPDKVPEGGVNARCSECSDVFFVDAEPASETVGPEELPTLDDDEPIGTDLEVGADTEGAVDVEAAPDIEPEIEDDEPGLEREQPAAETSFEPHDYFSEEEETDTDSQGLPGLLEEEVEEPAEEATGPEEELPDLGIEGPALDETAFDETGLEEEPELEAVEEEAAVEDEGPVEEELEIEAPEPDEVAEPAVGESAVEEPGPAETADEPVGEAGPALEEAPEPEIVPEDAEEVPGEEIGLEEPADEEMGLEEPAGEEIAPEEPATEATTTRRPAFGSRSPEEKAQRLARVLVSDMITYNPDMYQKALAQGTLKEDFAEEIEKSWEEYVEQVGEDLANSTSHWTDALNDILARGEQTF